MPALLSVQPLNLALLRHPHFENRPALMADFDDRPALLVDAAGEHSLMFDWSARGNPRPGGLRSTCVFPPAVAAILELDLPPDHLVSLEEPAQPVRLDPAPNPPPDPPLLSGPHDAGVPGLRSLEDLLPRLRGRLPSRSRPGFGRHAAGGCAVPAGDDPGATSGIGRGPLQVPARGAGRGVRELLFECDPGLIPWDVTVQGPQAALRDWEAHRERGGVTRLTVRLVEPVEEATVLIDALAPLRTLGTTGEPAAVPWTSPNIRPVGVVNRGEELELKLDPELRPEDWSPGDFRLSGADHDSDPAQRERFYRLTLVGGSLLEEAATRRDGDGQSRRPSMRLLAPGTEYRARQLAWWQVRAAGELLTVQIAYEVKHGTLERLPLLLPWDWDVESVSVGDRLLKSSRIDRGQGRPVLLAELTEPLRATARPSAQPRRSEWFSGQWPALPRPSRRSARPR